MWRPATGRRLRGPSRGVRRGRPQQPWRQPRPHPSRARQWRPRGHSAQPRSLGGPCSAAESGPPTPPAQQKSAACPQTAHLAGHARVVAVAAVVRAAVAIAAVAVVVAIRVVADAIVTTPLPEPLLPAVAAGQHPRPPVLPAQHAATRSPRAPVPAPPQTLAHQTLAQPRREGAQCDVIDWCVVKQLQNSVAGICGAQ